MKRVRLWSLLLALYGMLAPGYAWSGSPSPAGRGGVGVLMISRCEVEYARTTRVGVSSLDTAATVLRASLVELGDRVRAGQVLGRVEDRELRVELELRTATAESDIEERVTEAKYAQMQSRQKRTENLLRRSRDLVSEEEYNLQRLESTSAQLAVEEARHRRRLAELQRRQTESKLRTRELVSPHDGVVVEITKQEGEPVHAGDGVYLVVDVDRLKVTGHVNLGEYWRVKKGQGVRVYPEVEGLDLRIESEEFGGRLKFVDSRIDPVTRTSVVVAEVENRGGRLVSGLEARMEIDLDEVSKAPAPVVPVAEPVAAPAVRR